MLSLNRVVFPLLLFSMPALGRSYAPGIENFYQVDAHVCRGAQPTQEGFRYLAKIGVKTVVDLRESGDRSAREQDAVTSLGMRYVNVPMTGLTPPTEAQIAEVLRLLESQSAGAVFVHCMRGADRTGTVIAAYRIDHDHWANERALKEARLWGMAFFQFPRQHYIRKFQPLTAQERAEAIGSPSAQVLVPSALTSVTP